MQTIVQHISRLFVSYNDYLATKIDSVDKKALDKLLHEGFLKTNQYLKRQKLLIEKRPLIKTFCIEKKTISRRTSKFRIWGDF